MKALDWEVVATEKQILRDAQDDKERGGWMTKVEVDEGDEGNMKEGLTTKKNVAKRMMLGGDSRSSPLLVQLENFFAVW